MLSHRFCCNAALLVGVSCCLLSAISLQNSTTVNQLAHLCSPESSRQWPTASKLVHCSKQVLEYRISRRCVCMFEVGLAVGDSFNAAEVLPRRFTTFLCRMYLRITASLQHGSHPGRGRYHLQQSQCCPCKIAAPTSIMATPSKARRATKLKD